MFDITSPAPVFTGIAQCSGMQLADINNLFNLFIVISTYRYSTSTGTVLLVRIYVLPVSILHTLVLFTVRYTNTWGTLTFIIMKWVSVAPRKGATI